MSKFKNILILAGGDGTRFWPFENKNLVSFLGQPLIKYIIAGLLPYTNRLFVAGTKEVKKQLDPGVKFILQDGKLPQNQSSAILAAKDEIKGEVLILNSNDILDFATVVSLLNKVRSEKLEFVLAAKKIKNYFPGGYLKLDNGKLSGVVEKPGAGNMPSQLFRLVVDYFADFSKLVSLIEAKNQSRDDLYETVLDESTRSFNCGYLSYDGYWFSLKYPWHILPMMGHFLKTQITKVKLGKNVKISNTARLIGPIFIDDNTVVGDFAMIRASHIGKNCLIGGYSEVARSYLSDGVMLHRNYVGDSILGKNVSMGAGAVSANYRFDAKSVLSMVNADKVDTQLPKLGAIVGDNSKIGINTAILPGIKIGKNTFIGPGEIVDADLKEELFVFRGKKVKNKLAV